MHFETTAKLLESLRPYLGNIESTTITENKNRKKCIYRSDIVLIDEKHRVGFEVMKNEVIVFYFTDHCHFEDYSSSPAEKGNDYIQRAKEFLSDLLQHRIRHIETFKGKTLVSEKYFMLYPDGRGDRALGITLHGLCKRINPFRKKENRSTTWLYDKAKDCFTTRSPKHPAPEAIEVIDIHDDCYIEIFEDRDGYSYNVMEIDFDEYYGMYYWAPAISIIPSGLYDTREKAIEYAMKAVESKPRG